MDHNPYAAPSAVSSKAPASEAEWSIPFAGPNSLRYEWRPMIVRWFQWSAVAGLGMTAFTWRVDFDALMEAPLASAGHFFSESLQLAAMCLVAFPLIQLIAIGIVRLRFVPRHLKGELNAQGVVLETDSVVRGVPWSEIRFRMLSNPAEIVLAGGPLLPTLRLNEPMFASGAFEAAVQAVGRCHGRPGVPSPIAPETVQQIAAHPQRIEVHIKSTLGRRLLATLPDKNLVLICGALAALNWVSVPAGQLNWSEILATPLLIAGASVALRWWPALWAKRQAPTTALITPDYYYETSDDGNLIYPWAEVQRRRFRFGRRLLIASSTWVNLYLWRADVATRADWETIVSLARPRAGR